MGHRNSNLSFIAGANIRKGRALKMQSDGTVVEITDNKDNVVGFSTSMTRKGHQIGVRTLFEGTITVEIYKDAIDMYAGCWLTLTDDGRMQYWSSNDSDARMGVLLNNLKDDYDNGIYGEVLVLRHFNIWDRPDP